MSSQITVVVTGYLGKDAQKQFLPNGTPVLKFSVAGSVGFGQRQQTQWLSCSLFGQRGDSLAQYLTKGTLVQVIGTLSQPIAKDNDWFNVSVMEVSLLSRGEDRESEPEAAEEAEYDEIPF